MDDNVPGLAFGVVLGVIICMLGGEVMSAESADPALVQLVPTMKKYNTDRTGRKSAIQLTPARPKENDRVKVSVCVFNLGGRVSRNLKITLWDGKTRIAKRNISSLAASASHTFKFDWTATSGWHCLVAKIDSDADARLDNNQIFLPLVIGDRRRAHPYLLLSESEIPGWRKRVAKGKQTDKWFSNILDGVHAMSGRWSPNDYHEGRSLTAHSAALLFVLNDDKKMRNKAVAILKSVGKKGKVYESTKPGSWDDRQRICGIANYCMAYDLVASTLSEKDDRLIRGLLAKEIKHHVEVLTNTRVHAKYVGSFHYYVTGFALAALALADYDDTEKGAPDFNAARPALGKGTEWLDLALQAVWLEYNARGSAYDASGYLMHGLGYLGQAQSRAAAACWIAFEHVGFNLFSAFPFLAKVNKYYLGVMLPNGWAPPTDNASVRTDAATVQGMLAPVYPNPADQAVARWAWKRKHIKERSAEWEDSHWYYMFIYRATPEDLKGETHPPTWPATQFFTSHSVLRSNWSEDASYLMLNHKHWPGKYHGHIEDDSCSVQYFAKRAYLIVDPGYGQGSYPICNSVVKPWCRGWGYSQSMILIDGHRPGPAYGLRRPSAHGSYYPQNRFRTAEFHFAESHASEIKGWADALNEKATGITHTRSVIFHPRSEYFIMLDDIRDKNGGKHKYESVLIGNSRKPFKSDAALGDFVKKPRRVGDVKRASNLVIKNNISGGQAGEWTIENLAGDDVVCQAFFATPLGTNLKLRSGDGWLGYRSSVAGRCKFLVATVEKSVSTKYLCVLSSRYANRKTNWQVKALTQQELVGGRGHTAGVRIQLKDGEVHWVLFQDGGKELRAVKIPSSDGAIALLAVRRNHVKYGMLVRGQTLGYKKQRLVSAASMIEHAAFQFSDKEIRGHLNLDKATEIHVRCDFIAKSATYQPEPKDWVWVWTDKLKAKYKPRPLAFKQKGGMLILECPSGVGRITAR